MRYVSYDPKKIKKPRGWAKEVKQLEVLLRNEKDDIKRAELINKNDHLWKEIKEQLALLFNNKCWYTESPQNGTDTDVDHYRPKKQVAELNKKGKKHTGYWWLAFKLENYRYSCIVANRRRRDVVTGKTGGKADHFPLLDENKRAWTPTCEYEDEQPILLDPCKVSDVALLTFKENGEAMPRYKENSNPRLFKRADISIEYYHLNHTDFVNARIDLRDEIDKQLKSAQRFYKKLETGDATHELAFEDAMKKLRSLCHCNSPYSSFCKAYLEAKNIDYVNDCIKS